MPRPTVSVVIPTRARPQYLAVALSSIAGQAADAGAEVLVVDDAGDTSEARALAERFRASYVPHARPRGLNVARNTGVERSHGELVVFVDDDVRAAPGWLDALARAAAEHPDVDVFTGPIEPRLEGRELPGCGRERPPITSLDLGRDDTRTVHAWGANMAIRRSALERVGPFDESIEHGGDEQEWQERLAAASLAAPSTAAASRAATSSAGPASAVTSSASTSGAATSGAADGAAGIAMYVAGARVEHRRAGADARLRALARVAHTRGRAARRLDARCGRAPRLRDELVTLARCTAHVVRRRCAAGVVIAAHSAGRVREAARERGRRAAARTERARPRGARGATAADVATPDDFLSGESGTVGGIDALRRELLDAGMDAIEVASGRRRRLVRAARAYPPRRRVLVLGVELPERRELARAARAELSRSRHEVEIHTRAASEEGKFHHVNALLAEHPLSGYDWLLVVDDDVGLPRGFLDSFLFVCERFELRLAQPAQRLASHAAWRHTRREPWSVAREVAMVEIGPLTAFHHDTFATFTPFPDVRMGWGLDLHWAALARARSWRCGVVDAVAIRHGAAPVAVSYARDAAVEEAREFLRGRPYLSAADARRTLGRHRGW